MEDKIITMAIWCLAIITISMTGLLIGLGINFLENPIERGLAYIALAITFYAFLSMVKGK